MSQSGRNSDSGIFCRIVTIKSGNLKAFFENFKIFVRIGYTGIARGLCVCSSNYAELIAITGSGRHTNPGDKKGYVMPNLEGGYARPFGHLLFAELFLCA